MKCGITTLLLVSLLSACASKVSRIQRAKPQLKGVAVWMSQYAEQNEGRFPANLDELARFAPPEYRTSCSYFVDGSHGYASPWAYFPPPASDTEKTTPLVVLPFSETTSDGNQRRAALLRNMEVAVIDEREFQELAKRIKPMRSE